LENKKIDLKPFWKNNKLVLKLFNIFGKENIKIVGGAVRVALKGNQTNDLDFAVKLKPNLVKKKLAKGNIKFIDNSKGHGTVSIFSKDSVIEITSIRKDIKTFGRKAKVEFANSFEEDSKRRDFTINSIYSDLEGNLYDPYDGISDLNKNIIKFIGNPLKRIEEDNLRLLRYFRFVGVYCDKEDQLHIKSLNASIDNFSKIQFLSKERVQLEFFKLVVADNVSLVLLILQKNNLLNFLIKGLQKINKKSIKLFNKLPKQVIIRIAYLITKTEMKVIDVQESLKISNSDVLKLKKIISVKTLILNEIDAKVHKYYYGDEISIANYLLNQFIKEKNISKKILNILEHWSPPQFPINGNDIIKYKNITGKDVGIILKNIEKWWVRSSFVPGRKECLEKMKNI
tara:strand:- start:16763 stop:17959 length:1197 start_codon:yes stop_codon:yes gene_type:complete